MNKNRVNAIRRRLEQLLASKLEPYEMRRIRKAADKAEYVHQQETRDDGTPYILHPLRVAEILAKELNLHAPLTIQVALIHDIRETDRGQSTNVLRKEFGEEVAASMDELTKPPRENQTREEANRDYFAKLQKARDVSKVVKLADKLDNVRDAVNCPIPDKRARTASEARELFDLLCPLLENQEVARRFRTLLAEGLRTLQGMY